MRKNLLACFCIAFSCAGCNRQSETSDVVIGELGSTIDSVLTSAVDSCLTSKMAEIEALQGQAIVMEVGSGEILAMVGQQLLPDRTYAACTNFTQQQYAGTLFSAAAYLAALETGKIHLSDTIDMRDGTWLIDGHLMRDHNWQRGGYGTDDYYHAIMYCSNTAVCKAVWQTFNENDLGFFDQLEKFSLGQPDSIEGIPGLKPMVYSSPSDSDWVRSSLVFHAIGYERQMTPIQMLTFYNAIANDGKMVKPTLRRGHSEIINEQIADIKNIRCIQQALVGMTSDIALGRKAGTSLVQVAVNNGVAILDDGTHNISVCGYFPADKPQYSLILSVNKENKPASAGGMLGPVFKAIVEWMCQHGFCCSE